MVRLVQDKPFNNRIQPKVPLTRRTLSALESFFTARTHSSQAKMEVCDECGHIVLVERLLRKLKLVNTCEEAREFKSESCFLLGLLSRNGILRR